MISDCGFRIAAMLVSLPKPSYVRLVVMRVVPPFLNTTLLTKVEFGQ
jgi:hypothetical protein